MTGRFPYGSIWEYLDELGVLVDGTEAEIQSAKRRYWKEYKKMYQRQYRKEKTEVIVRFSSVEMASLKVAAEEMSFTVQQYIRERVLNTKDTSMTKRERIKLLLKLSLMQTELENLIRNHLKGDLDRNEFDRILKGLQKLEALINEYDN